MEQYTDIPAKVANTTFLGEKSTHWVAFIAALAIGTYLIGRTIDYLAGE